MQTTEKIFPLVKMSSAIILAIVYTALAGVGMAYMYHVEGVSYGSPDMVYVFWWIQLIITVLTAIVTIKFFGITMGVGAFRAATGESKNIIFLFIIVILAIAIQLVFGIYSLSATQIEGLVYSLLVVIMVGFAEEVVYRGIIFRALYAKYGAVKAILGSSVIFSLLHAVNVLGGLSVNGMFVQLGLTFISGLGLAYLTYRANHLMPAIIFHILWNFLAFSSSHVRADISVIYVYYPIVLLVVIFGLMKISRSNNVAPFAGGDYNQTKSVGNLRSRKLGFIFGVVITSFLSIILAVFLISPTTKLLAQAYVMNLVTVTEFRVEGNVVYMSNEINSKTYDQFVEILEQNPQIDTLIEENVPGSMDDDTMIKLAYLVRERGLNTRLLKHSMINSGGVDLFLAGVNRSMERGAHVGVHSWSDSGRTLEASDIPKDDPRHELNRKYIEDMLGNDDFYWFTIYAAPADGIYEMYEQEIIDYGLVTEPIIINETGAQMPGVLADKLVVLGNKDAKKVYIYAQGGPVAELSADEAYDLLLKEGGLKSEDIMLVVVHQAQTIYPWMFSKREIDFQQAINYDVESVRFMGATIQFFKEHGKEVYVVGASFGAFIVADVIASYGNIADGYIILSGRLDIEDAFWQTFAEGRWAIFQDGNIIPADSTAAGMGGADDIIGRNLARLAAGLGYRRYTELLKDIPLENVVYGFGTMDEQVGPLSKKEAEFLLSKNSTVLSAKANHSDAISFLISEAIESLHAKKVLNN